MDDYFGRNAVLITIIGSEEETAMIWVAAFVCKADLLKLVRSSFMNIVL